MKGSIKTNISKDQTSTWCTLGNVLNAHRTANMACLILNSLNINKSPKLRFEVEDSATDRFTKQVDIMEKIKA